MNFKKYAFAFTLAALGVFSASAQIVPIPTVSIDGPNTDLQSQLNLHNVRANVNTDQLAQRQFMQCDTTPISIQILFQQSAYTNHHRLGFYNTASAPAPVNYILGQPATGLTANATFSAANFFSLALDTPNGMFRAEKSLTPDLFEHAVVLKEYDANNQLIPCSYIVAFEDLYNGGDKDYNDIVVRVQGVQAVPEPGTLAAALTALPGLLAAVRRKTKK